ncbi:MAG: hypothetical protein AAF357_08430, partial [Verrucomicrobiota bacterium]
SRLDESVAESLDLSGVGRLDKENTIAESSGSEIAALLGTFGYLAPELELGKQSHSEASDLYAVGLMTFQMLTGQRKVGLEGVSELRPGLHQEWESWLRESMASQVESRFADAVTMRERLPSLTEPEAEIHEESEDPSDAVVPIWPQEPVEPAVTEGAVEESPVLPRQEPLPIASEEEMDIGDEEENPWFPVSTALPQEPFEPFGAVRQVAETSSDPEPEGYSYASEEVDDFATEVEWSSRIKSAPKVLALGFASGVASNLLLLPCSDFPPQSNGAVGLVWLSIVPVVFSVMVAIAGGWFRDKVDGRVLRFLTWIAICFLAWVAAGTTALITEGAPAGHHPGFVAGVGTSYFAKSGVAAGLAGGVVLLFGLWVLRFANVGWIASFGFLSLAAVLGSSLAIPPSFGTVVVDSSGEILDVPWLLFPIWHTGVIFAIHILLPMRCPALTPGHRVLCAAAIIIALPLFAFSLFLSLYL